MQALPEEVERIVRSLSVHTHTQTHTHLYSPQSAGSWAPYTTRTQALPEKVERIVRSVSGMGIHRHTKQSMHLAPDMGEVQEQPKQLPHALDAAPKVGGAAERVSGGTWRMHWGVQAPRRTCRHGRGAGALLAAAACSGSGARVGAMRP